MARQSSRERARTVLRDAIISLCRETIPHKDEIAVEGLLGITVDQKDTWLVTIHEMIGGGQCKKRKLSDSSSLGISVRDVVGNANMYFQVGSESDDEQRVMPKRKYRSANSASIAAKRSSMSNGSPKVTNVQKVDIMGETVDIKQEKPDSESEDHTPDDAGNWELCVDQMQTSNDDALANEVLEMSKETLESCPMIDTKQVHRRLSSKIRLHEFSKACGDHRPHLIPPTARRSHPQKRCRVCYKEGLRKESRYCCPVCPGYPGLCVVPCFELYHADRSYQSANLGFGFNFQEVDPMFDITHALGLRQKGHHMIVKQDSMGRRTVLSTEQTKALIQNEYVGPDNNIYMAAIGGRHIKPERNYNEELVLSDIEGQTEDEEKQRVQEENEMNEEIKMLVSDVASVNSSTSGHLTLQEVTEAQIHDEVSEVVCAEKDKDEIEQVQETNTVISNAEQSVDDELTKQIAAVVSTKISKTAVSIPSTSSDNKRTVIQISESASEPAKLLKVPNSTNVKTFEIESSSQNEITNKSESGLRSGNEPPQLNTIEISSKSTSEIPKSIKIIQGSSRKFTKTIKIVPVSNSEHTKTIQHEYGTRSKPLNKPLPTEVVNTVVPVSQDEAASVKQKSSPIVMSPIKMKVSNTTTSKVVPQVQTSVGKSTYVISASSLLENESSPPAINTGTRVGTLGPGSIISLPPGALSSGGKGPTAHAGLNTKTYMITKSAGGIIKKTPIILRTVPMGTRLPAGPVSGATTMVKSTTTSIKTVKNDSKLDSKDNTEPTDYTIDLVPTPTSLNTQVLKVMVGKPLQEFPE